MDQKLNKTYLPTTLEQYIQQKKKQTSKFNYHHNSLNKHSVHDNDSIERRTSTKQNKTKKTQIKQIQNINTNQSLVIKEVIIHSEFKKLFDDFNNSKFQKIKENIQNQLVKLQQYQTVPILSINDILKQLNIQSFDNISRLQKQFEVPSGKRNFQLLDSMLAFNKFFIILNRQKRLKIYDNSQFITYDEGETIYQEGQIDEFMFIVIKGCVKQFEKRTTTFNERVTVNFITHYQGSNFGDTILVSQNQKSKRYHSAVATQKTYLLKLRNSFYRDLITNSKEDDFEKKLNALLAISIFKDTSKLFVMPLVSTIEKVQLDYGKVLIRQGDYVRKLYFVASGSLQLIYIDRAKRSIKHLNIEQKPQNFYLKKQDHKKNRNLKSYSIHNTFYYPSKKQCDKQFVFGSKEVEGQQLLYNQHVVFSQLRMGDFLGGKSFLTEIDIQKKATQDKNFTKGLQSNLTVLSSAIQTVVYALDQKKFFSLSDNLQRVIIEGILASTYFDQINIEQKKGAQREWKKYSQKLVENVIKDKKIRNHSFRN